MHEVHTISTAHLLLHVALEEGNMQYVLGAIAALFGGAVWAMTTVFVTNRQLEERMTTFSTANTQAHKALNVKLDKIMYFLMGVDLDDK